MPETLISEALKPVIAAADTTRMSVGEPGLPKEFIWRKRTVRVESVRREWRETGPCHHGSGEMYVRKHWYEVTVAGGDIWKIYFDRQARGGPKSKRWWLFSIVTVETEG